MAQFEFIEWLVQWLFQDQIIGFHWDLGNSTKSLQKHKIETESAEQVFQNKDALVPLGIQTMPKVDKPRFGALGMDLLGKMLSVCFTVREGKIRVISIRPMSKSERKKYASLRKK